MKYSNLSGYTQISDTSQSEEFHQIFYTWPGEGGCDYKCLSSDVISRSQLVANLKQMKKNDIFID